MNTSLLSVGRGLSFSLDVNA